LTKMSSKSAIKFVVAQDAHSTLFKWVAVLTGSKNALKGVGFFLGGVLLSALGFRATLHAMAAALAVALVASAAALPRDLGRAKVKTKLAHLVSKSRAINVLSAARFFLFGARDVWFVVGVPVFLSLLGWSFTQVGGFLAAWVIGYGIVQSLAPAVIGRFTGGHAPRAGSARALAWMLAIVTAAIAVAAHSRDVVVAGLAVFGTVFALGSSVHSYLILAYSEGDQVTLDVGFYYMANAAGRLVGTVLSGVLYQLAGLEVCLWGSAAFAAATALLSLLLPDPPSAPLMSSLKVDAGGD